MEDHVDLVDALPYYDPPAERAVVERELQKDREAKVDLSKYIAHLPNPPELKFENSVFLATEFNRIRAGKPSIKISSKRVKVGPPEKDDDIDGWEAAVTYAKAELGYQEARMLQLQLLKKYGKDAWIAYNNQVQKTKSGIDRELEDCKIEINEINLTRKREHERAGTKLSQMDARHWDLLQNAKALEERIAKMQKHE